MSVLSNQSVDVDGAIAEAQDAVAGDTRAAFFRKAAIGGGAVLGSSVFAGMLPELAAAKPSKKQDIKILNYALTLEYLEAAFYKEAVDRGALSGQLARFAEIVAEHEQAHVDALKKALGSKAVSKPSFDFKGTTDAASTFGSTAMVLEDTGVRAYQGQATNIKSTEVLKAAISIHPVEARHAAWIANILSKGSGSPSPAPEAFNPADDMATVLAAVKGTGFITTEQGASPGSAVDGTPSVTG